MDGMYCFTLGMTIIFVLLGIWHYFLGNVDMVLVSILFIAVCFSWTFSRARRRKEQHG